jgi:hypothetical protein
MNLGGGGKGEFFNPQVGFVPMYLSILELLSSEGSLRRLIRLV